ncbi:MAG: endonuclease/exonuclease/phosphatase family protein [Bacteroidota bacterium]
MKKTLRWLNILLIFVTLLSYLSPFVDPANYWPFAFIGIAYPWLLLLNMLFILAWVALKNWYFLFSLGCILVGWNHFQSFIGLNTAAPIAEKEITVMTFNAFGYRQLKKEARKKFDQMLATYQPDLIAMQEGASRSSPIDPSVYPYVYHPKGKLLSIHSKHPFANKGKLDFGNTSNGCIFVDLKVHSRPFRIYNVHLQSNGVSGDASKIKNEGDLQQKETWLDIKGMLGKVKRATAKRSAQTKAVIEHLKTSKLPVIVCGDMNDTPLSYTYQSFANNLEDGFKERAMGTGTTYDGTIPVLRIDYIWTDADFQVQSHQIIKENFSDHYPVISRIRL